MPELRLDAIASFIGRRRPLQEAEDLAPEAQAMLLESGFEQVPIAEHSPPEMARRALAETLSAAPIHPRDVQTVLWVSTSFQERRWYTDDVSHVLAGLGLGHTDVIGVTLGECGNLGPALRIASRIGGTGLLVCTDAVRPGATRLVPPQAAMLGDGAVSCLFSDTGPISVLSVAQVSNHRLRTIDPQTQSVRVLRVTARGIEQAAKKALEQAGVDPASIDALLLTNQNAAVRALFADRAGVDLERIQTPSLAQNAHLFSGDLLIGLQQLSSQLEPGALVLAVANGTCTWSAFICRIGEPP